MGGGSRNISMLETAASGLTRDASSIDAAAIYLLKMKRIPFGAVLINCSSILRYQAFAANS